MKVDVWKLRSRLYDRLEASDRRRWAAKRRLFSRVRGRALLVAAGTGIDFSHLPASDVVAVDLSAAMLARARQRVSDGPARVTLLRTDALCLPFQDGTFDTVVTSCSMCSVPQPAVALSEIHRVLRADGRLLMFEHVRSRQALLGLALDLMTAWTRFTGTDMNRETLRTVADRGFRLLSVEPVYLDIIVAVEALKMVSAPTQHDAIRHLRAHP